MDELYVKVSAKCHNLRYNEQYQKRMPCNYVGEAFVLKSDLDIGEAKFRCPDCVSFIHQKDSKFIVIT